jgi:hypothetical protein
MAYRSGPDPDDWYSTAFPQTSSDGMTETMVEAMLFCTDYPAMAWFTAEFLDPSNAPIPVNPSHFEPVKWWGAGLFEYYANQLFVPQVPQVHPRQVAIGKSYTNGVHVRGYPCGAIIPYYGYLDKNADLMDAYLHWYFIANTTVQTAPVPFDFWNGWTVPVPLDMQPVLVREQDYTAEIAETNMLSFNDGWLQYEWPVVGIFATVITDWGKQGKMKAEGEDNEILYKSLAARHRK